MHALSHVTIDRCHVTALLGSCDSRVPVSLQICLVRAQSVQTVMAEGEEEGEREGSRRRRKEGWDGRKEREGSRRGRRKGGMGGRRKEV